MRLYIHGTLDGSGQCLARPGDVAWVTTDLMSELFPRQALENPREESNSSCCLPPPPFILALAPSSIHPSPPTGSTFHFLGQHILCNSMDLLTHVQGTLEGGHSRVSKASWRLLPGPDAQLVGGKMVTYSMEGPSKEARLGE